MVNLPAMVSACKYSISCGVKVSLIEDVLINSILKGNRESSESQILQLIELYVTKDQSSIAKSNATTN